MLRLLLIWFMLVEIQSYFFRLWCILTLSRCEISWIDRVFHEYWLILGLEVLAWLQFSLASLSLLSHGFRTNSVLELMSFLLAWAYIRRFFINQIVRFNMKFSLHANLKLLLIQRVWLMFCCLKAVNKSLISICLWIIKTETWDFFGIVCLGLDQICRLFVHNKLVLIAREKAVHTFVSHFMLIHSIMHCLRQWFVRFIYAWRGTDWVLKQIDIAILRMLLLEEVLMLPQPSYTTIIIFLA